MMLEWRNWQTHWTQNPAPFTGHEGSTPSSSTSEAAGGEGRDSRADAGTANLLALLLLAAATVPALPLAAQEPAKPDTDPPEAASTSGQPDWLSLGGEFRVRYENRQALGYQAGRDDGYALVRTRIDIGIEPTGWLKFGFQGQDARAPGIREGVGNIGAFRDGFDIRQAYVQIGGGKSPVAVTVGRQLLAYGDQRLVGALDWANTSRAFDAVKLELRAPSAKVDLFSASVVQNDPFRRINQSAEGNNLHGVYGAIENVIPGSTLEPYVLWQTTPVVVDELNVRGDMDRYTTGLRAWGTDLGPWDYNVALVGQRGNLAGASIEAWAYYAELGYSIDANLDPRLYVDYNFGSGDDDPGDGVVGGFVDVYPTAHRWYGYNDLVGWRNVKNLRLGAQVQPHQKLGLQFDFHSFWLVSKRDALYNVGGRLAVAPPPEGATEAKVGDEVNATFSAVVTESISLGGGIGYMFPGPYLKAYSPGDGNTFSFLAIAIKF